MKKHFGIRQTTAVIALSMTAANGFADPCTDAQKLLAPDGAAIDYFGFATAMDGDVAIIGAPSDTLFTNESGAAYVFRFNGSTWAYEQTLTPSDGAADDQFGAAVAIHGNVAIVGAPLDNLDGPVNDAGSAYIFRYNGLTWVQEQKLIHPTPDTNDRFGESVAIEDDVAVAGVPRDNDPMNDRGAAYVFRHNGSSWVQEQKLLSSDAAADDWFGRTIAISGNVILVGALLDDITPPQFDAGSAYVFRYNGASWVQEKKLFATDAAASDWYSYGLDIDGDVVAIGARLQEDPGNLNQGAVYVYHYTGSDWVEQPRLTASDPLDNDEYGFSVGVDGDAIIVGAKFSNVGIDDTGAAYIYHFNGLNWGDEQRLLAFDGVDEDNFGWSVAISGDHVIVGALNDDDLGPSSGSAYAFSVLACSGGCAEDLSGDGLVDGADLGLLLSNWGGSGVGDLNGDGIVNGADLGQLLATWGSC